MAIEDILITTTGKVAFHSNGKITTINDAISQTTGETKSLLESLMEARAENNIMRIEIENLQKELQELKS